jgi:hypothetical protein
MKPSVRPNPNFVRSVAEEEARRSRVSLSLVLGASVLRSAVEARRRAMRRILATTGCTMTALAEVWGCEADSVKRAVQAVSQAGERPTYDSATIERLTWRYGPARTAQIIGGSCPHTNRDIAAWRGLGRGA